MNRIPVLIRLSIPFFLGIFTAGYSTVSLPWVWLLLLSLSLLFIRALNAYSRLLVGLLTILFFYFLGVYRYQQALPPEVDPGPFLMRAEVVSGETGSGSKRSILIRSGAMYKLILPENFIGVLLPGDSLLVSGEVKIPPKIILPYSFNKASLAESMGWSAEVLPFELKLISSHNHLLRWPAFMGRWILNRVEDWNMSREAKGFIVAMLTGDKVLLSSDMRSDFSSLGIAHVLAVSGMHIGLLYVLLLKILFFLKGKSKRWKRTVALVFIWFFVLLTGAGPSAVRAAVMFSFFAFSDWLYRPFSTGDALFTSAFFLVWYQPSWLFSAGFQLSYAALLGIVYLHPMISSWNRLPTKIGAKVWEASSAAIAAQITTLPFLIYWFHAFPLYFLPANLILVPLLMLLMYGAIAALILPYDFLQMSLDQLVSFILTVVEGMRKLPGGVFDGVYWEAGPLFLLGLTLIGIMIALVHRSTGALKFSIFTALVFFGWLIVKAQNRVDLIIHKKGNLWAIEQIEGQHSIVYTTSFFSEQSFYWKVESNNFRKSLGVDSVEFQIISKDKLLELSSHYTNSTFERYAVLTYSGGKWEVIESR